METLEIKHLLPYVGNNIIVRNEIFQSNYNGNEFGILNGIYPLYDKDKNIFWQFTIDNNSTGNPIRNCQPLLKPLEDVCKETKGGVIPMLFCAHFSGIEVSNVHDFKSQGFNFRIENKTAILERKTTNKTFEGFEIDLDKEFGFNKFNVLKTKTGREYKSTITLTQNPHKIVEYLFSKGFDINNLIGKGLALNINDFEQFQY